MATSGLGAVLKAAQDEKIIALENPAANDKLMAR